MHAGECVSKIICVMRDFRKNLIHCRRMGFLIVVHQNSNATNFKKQHRKLNPSDKLPRLELQFGKFGVAKRRYSLGRIMTKLASTSECVIAMTFIVMNLQKLIGIFLSLFQKLCFLLKKLTFRDFLYWNFDKNCVSKMVKTV